MKPETKFRKKFTTWMRDHLKHSEDTSIQQLGISGTPDKYLCLNGWFVALEFKSEEGHPTKLQLHKMQKIRLNGRGIAMIVEPDNAEEVKQILLAIDRGEPPCQKRLRENGK